MLLLPRQFIRWIGVPPCPGCRYVESVIGYRGTWPCGRWRLIMRMLAVSSRTIQAAGRKRLNRMTLLARAKWLDRLFLQRHNVYCCLLLASIIVITGFIFERSNIISCIVICIICTKWIAIIDGLRCNAAVPPGVCHIPRTLELCRALSDVILSCPNDSR